MAPLTAKSGFRPISAPYGEWRVVPRKHGLSSPVWTEDSFFISNAKEIET